MIQQVSASVIRAAMLAALVVYVDLRLVSRKPSRSASRLLAKVVFILPIVIQAFATVSLQPTLRGLASVMSKAIMDVSLAKFVMRRMMEAPLRRVDLDSPSILFVRTAMSAVRETASSFLRNLQLVCVDATQRPMLAVSKVFVDSRLVSKAQCQNVYWALT